MALVLVQRIITIYKTIQCALRVESITEAVADDLKTATTEFEAAGYSHAVAQVYALDKLGLLDGNVADVIALVERRSRL